MIDSEFDFFYSSFEISYALNSENVSIYKLLACQHLHVSMYLLRV